MVGMGRVGLWLALLYVGDSGSVVGGGVLPSDKTTVEMSPEMSKTTSQTIRCDTLLMCHPFCCLRRDFNAKTAQMGQSVGQAVDFGSLCAALSRP